MKNVDYGLMWSTYESNVQSYRSNFIASQSILLAVGALLINYSLIYILSISIIAILQIWYIWNRVIISRLKIVDYYKFRLGLYFNNEGKYTNAASNKNMLREDIYIKNKMVREMVHSQMKENPYWGKNSEFKTIRVTRRKIDMILPIFFSVLWIVLVFASYYK